MEIAPCFLAAFEGLSLPADACGQIVARHSEPQRHYHTLRHLEIMLDALPRAHAMRPEMIAATLYHDIVYDPKRSDNEEKSAALFEADASGLGLGSMIEPVVAMILATKAHHFRQDDTEFGEAINHLLRADLGILWHQDPAIYAWYAEGVRKEYAFVPEDRYCEARSRILTGLRDDLIDSRRLAEQEIDFLRRNIASEISQLSA